MNRKWGTFCSINNIGADVACEQLGFHAWGPSYQHYKDADNETRELIPKADSDIPITIGNTFCGRDNRFESPIYILRCNCLIIYEEKLRTHALTMTTSSSVVWKTHRFLLTPRRLDLSLVPILPREPWRCTTLTTGPGGTCATQGLTSMWPTLLAGRWDTPMLSTTAALST